MFDFFDLGMRNADEHGADLETAIDPVWPSASGSFAASIALEGTSASRKSPLS
jgi:hypothetical protein